jgi:trans-AT polyketide synthase/acyltransferase/oxidoreductase domain-containing protein
LLNCPRDGVCYGSVNERCTRMSSSVTADALGSEAFRRAHGVRYAYAAGAMVKGIASEALVVRMARARLLSYFGTGGLALDRVRDAIDAIERQVGPDAPWGMNLLCNTMRPEKEDETVRLFLDRRVRRIEASAFTQITRSIVLFRLRGLRQAQDGTVITRGMVQAKISRPEVAIQFMSPAPERLVAQLRDQGSLTTDEARLSASIPMADDICVEADSGGHTDKGVSLALIPTMIRLRDQAMEKHRFAARIRVGAAGGLGTPEAVAAAFVLGAEFVLTGSINQCTVEAGTSDAVKDLLQSAGVQDTDMAPAGDMFELGARVQVLKKGLFFSARANKLYELYRQHDSVDQIDAKTRQQIEEKYFGRSFADVEREVRAYLQARNPSELQRFDAQPKLKMARIFQWYFARTNQAAIGGDEAQRLNFQIHSGPAMGACNTWLKGTPFEPWRARHVDQLADMLMRGAADVLSERLRALTAASQRMAS